MSPDERARRDVVVATVGPRSIRAGELEDRLATMPDFQRASYGKSEPEVRRGVLERILVRDALIAVAAETAVDDPLLRYELARARSSATMRELSKALTEPQHLPEAEVTAYYEAHKGEYQAPLRAHLWRILLPTAADAEAVLAALRSDGTPDTWAKLCREKSIDEATKLRRGTLGFVAADGSSSETGIRVPVELARAALNVADGELVQQVVPEGEAFAVIWRRGSTPARAQTLKAAEPEIRRLLAEKNLREAREQLLGRLRSEHVKDVDETLLATASLPAPEPVLKVHAPKTQ